jgi:hypothetical protein
MSCLEMPRTPVPDFLGEPRRASNDAATMQPRAPGRCRPTRGTVRG